MILACNGDTITWNPTPKKMRILLRLNTEFRSLQRRFNAYKLCSFPFQKRIYSDVTKIKRKVCERKCILDKEKCGTLSVHSGIFFDAVSV